MAFTYDYTSGTMRVPAPIVYASAVHPITAAEPVADTHLAEGGAEIPLKALRSIEASPGASGVDLTWSISVNDHVDGFNVYRVDGAGEKVFAGNEASFEVADGDRHVPVPRSAVHRRGDLLAGRARLLRTPRA